MPIDDRTTNRNYQLPNAGNLLSDDVARLRAALQGIDADVFARYTKTEVDTLINNLINGAPGALDTLNELAAAMGDDPNFAATVTNALALKANIVDVYTKAQADARYVQGQTQAEMVFVATANQSVFTLTTAVINKPSALVTVDGVVQPTSEYTLNMTGTQLTLSEGVPAGTIVRVLALGVSSEGAPADDTVTTAKLRDGAVTTPKLADGALAATTAGRAKMADGYITPAKLSAGLVLKVQHFTDPGGTTASATLVSANTANFSYTPVSTNSTLLLLASFQLTTAYAGINLVSSVAIGNNGTSTGAYTFAANTSAGSASHLAPITMQATVSNTSTSARSFQMLHAVDNASGFTKTESIRFTVIEVAN